MNDGSPYTGVRYPAEPPHRSTGRWRAGLSHGLYAPLRSRVRLAVRVMVIVTLSGVAWLAWHPSAWRTAFLAPRLLTESRHALGPGVNLRLARTEGRPWQVVDFEVDLARAHLEVAAVPGGGF